MWLVGMARLMAEKVRVDPLYWDEIMARVEAMISEQDFFADRAEDELHELGTEGVEAPHTPSGEPWCGTPDDVIREAVTMAVAMTVRGVEEGRIEIVGSDSQARARHPAGKGRRRRLRLVQSDES